MNVVQAPQYIIVKVTVSVCKLIFPFFNGSDQILHYMKLLKNTQPPCDSRGQSARSATVRGGRSAAGMGDPPAHSRLPGEPGSDTYRALPVILVWRLAKLKAIQTLPIGAETPRVLKMSHKM